MEVIKLLLISTLLTIIPGQLLRIPLFSESGAITLSDLFALLTTLFFLTYAFIVKRSLKINFKIFFPVLLFSLSAVASSVLALDKFLPTQVVISSFFLIRFLNYSVLSIVVYNVIEKKHIDNWLNLIILIGVLFTVIGFIQLLIFPNLIFLTAYGWDPHQFRIVSTFLDPNFAGVIFVLTFTISISKYLFQKNQFRPVFLLVATLSFVALIFTFSRSSYLAFLIAILSLGVFKSPRVLIGASVLFFIAFLSIGQVRDRIIGAFTLDETSQARIQSWGNAFVIFKDNLLFGTGFNTYRLAQADYGFFTYDEPQGGHSGAGVDSSILLVAATTGIVGLGFFLFLLLSLLLLFKRNLKSNYLHLVSTVFFLALILHSQFVNSFFFPQIMLVLWFLIGLVQVNDAS